MSLNDSFGIFRCLGNILRRPVSDETHHPLFDIKRSHTPPSRPEVCVLGWPFILLGLVPSSGIGMGLDLTCIPHDTLHLHLRRYPTRSVCNGQREYLILFGKGWHRVSPGTPFSRLSESLLSVPISSRVNLRHYIKVHPCLREPVLWPHSPFTRCLFSHLWPTDRNVRLTLPVSDFRSER